MSLAPAPWLRRCITAWLAVAAANGCATPHESTTEPLQPSGGASNTAATGGSLSLGAQPGELTRMEGMEMLGAPGKTFPASFAAFLAGGVLCGGACTALDRVGRTRVPAPAPATPAPIPGVPRPPCPTCSAEMVWAVQYSRHYCKACRRYA